jgi:hypothetical protein
MADITSQLPRGDMKLFTKDFTELFRVYSGIKKEYARVSKDAGKYIKEFDKILIDFNKKYTGIILKLKRTSDDINLGIFLKEQNVKDVFVKVASRLEGLKAIGASEGVQVNVEEAERFAKEIEKVDQRIFISYFEQEGVKTVALQEKDSKLVEFIYGTAIDNERSPEFRLCSYYAVKDGVNDIEIHGRLSAMGFLENVSFKGAMNFFKKFNPKIEE